MNYLARLRRKDSRQPARKWPQLSSAASLNNAFYRCALARHPRIPSQPCANSPHLTTIRTRARVSTSTCLSVEKGRKRDEEEEKDEEEKEDVNSETLWGLTCPQSEIHVTLVQNRGVHSSAARERLSFSWHLRVELFTGWVRGRNVERKAGAPSSIGREPRRWRERGRKREGEGERNIVEKLHVWVGRDVWRAQLSRGATMRYCDIFGRISTRILLYLFFLEGVLHRSLTALE